MKFAAFVLLFAATCVAQGSSTASATAAGCGEAGVRFDVATDKHQHPLAQPDSAKAVVYFFQDDSQYEFTPRPTTRLGIDGQWVGATHSSSYFYVPVSAGEHRICASWQSVMKALQESSARHFTAQAGQAYFFRARNIWLKDHNRARMDFEQIDAAEGELLASKFGFSTSKPKK